MSRVVAQVVVLPAGVVSHLHRARLVNSMRPPARAVGDRLRCHLCLGKTARCIAMTASSCSVLLAIVARTRAATATAKAALAAMIVPVDGVVTGVSAAIPAGKILQGTPFRSE